MSTTLICRDIVIDNKYFLFTEYFVFEDSQETELHIQVNCIYVALEEYANINVYRNSTAAVNLNCCSLCRNMNDIKMLRTNFNQKFDISLFTKTWLSYRTIPLCMRGLLTIINVLKSKEVEVYLCMLIISILYLM